MKFKRQIAIFALFFVNSAFALPSFECEPFHLNLVEQKICDDHKLSKIDKTMVRLYQSSLQTKYINETNKEKIKSSQTNWLSGRNSCGKAIDIETCIKNKYSKRIATLRKYLSNTPSNILYKKGNEFYDNKDSKNALTAYKEAYNISDNVSDKVQSLGALYAIDNNDKYLKTLLQSDPKNDWALSLLGRNKYNTGKINTKPSNINKVSNVKLKEKIKHYHGEKIHSHIFPPDGWKHNHKKFSNAKPFQTEEEKSISKLDNKSWESLNDFLLKYGHLNTNAVKNAYKNLFSLKENGEIPRSDREFENDIIKYSKDFTRFVKINIINKEFKNTKTINILPETWVNSFHFTNSDMEIKISAERNENSKYKLKYDHDILLEFNLESTMIGEVSIGFFPITIPQDMDNITKKVKISLNKGSNNPISITFGKVTNAAGINGVNKGFERLTDGFIKAKTEMYHKLKFKILDID